MNFPTKEQIAKAHADMGFDPDAPESPPCCGKCGAPITTGAMALVCPYEKRCEFWCPEADEFAALFSTTDTSSDVPPRCFYCKQLLPCKCHGL